jgi:hypothetical protein
MRAKNNNIILYNTEDGKAKIELRLENGTIWLTELEIAELFQTTRQNVNKHIRNIFSDGDLDEKVVSNYQLLTTKHGAMEGRTQEVDTKFRCLTMGDRGSVA